jgi:hypothetical protein
MQNQSPPIGGDFSMPIANAVSSNFRKPVVMRVFGGLAV